MIMEQKYRRLYDFVSTIRVLCILCTISYVVFWFLKIINFPCINYAGIVFNPLTSIIKATHFLNWTIKYNDFYIDMTPIIAALGFQTIYFLLQPVLNTIKVLDRRHRLNKIAEKRLEEKLVNENLKEIFINKTLEYTKFAILLSLNVKADINPNMIEKNIDTNNMPMLEYVKIVNIMRKKYPTCKAITPGKLFMVYDNFTIFDDFLSDIITEVKSFCAENQEKGLITEFKVAIDAVEESGKVSKILEFLEKISALGYTNKAISTPAFKMRYNLNSQKNKYNLETIGISRFFENNLDKTQKGIDIELFSLKTFKSKAEKKGG